MLRVLAALLRRRALREHCFAINSAAIPNIATVYLPNRFVLEFRRISLISRHFPLCSDHSPEMLSMLGEVQSSRRNVCQVEGIPGYYPARRQRVAKRRGPALVIRALVVVVG